MTALTNLDHRAGYGHMAAPILVVLGTALGLIGACRWAQHLRGAAHQGHRVTAVHNVLVGADRAAQHAFLFGPIVLAAASGLALTVVLLYAVIRSADTTIS